MNIKYNISKIGGEQSIVIAYMKISCNNTATNKCARPFWKNSEMICFPVYKTLVTHATLLHDVSNVV